MTHTKLKVGDKFVYTKEMNDAKIKSVCSGDAKRLIGKTLKVTAIEQTVLNEAPVYKACNEGFLFPPHVIDDYLPSNKLKLSFAGGSGGGGNAKDWKNLSKSVVIVNTPNNRTWASNFVSSDGIEIRKEGGEYLAIIEGTTYSRKSLSAHYSKVCAALSKLKNLT